MQKWNEEQKVLRNCLHPTDIPLLDIDYRDGLLAWRDLLMVSDGFILQTTIGEA